MTTSLTSQVAGDGAVAALAGQRGLGLGGSPRSFSPMM